MHSNHTILVRKKSTQNARATFFNHLATDCIAVVVIVGVKVVGPFGMGPKTGAR